MMLDQRSHTTMVPATIPYPMPKIKRNVRVSSNERDSDVNCIMERLMSNRIKHKEYEQIIDYKDTKDCMRNLVF